VGAIVLGGTLLGLAVLINFLFVVNKLQHGKIVDAVVDVGVMMAASSIYGMSLMGGVSATFGSMFISIYLYYKPLRMATSSLNGLQGSQSKDNCENPLKRAATQFDKLFE
jgi:hypothetical protein